MAYTTIDKPDEYFNVNLWTGNQTLTNINVGFQPSFVWIKSRSNTQVHALFDQVRGVSIGALSSDTTSAENANQKLVAYTSNGFTLPSTNYEWTNTTGWTYVGWSWIGNGAGVSNTQGSITSTVSANTTSGFSIVGWTGTGANGTIGHGLGTAPAMIIVKARGAVKDWMVGHNSMGWTKYINLNTSSAESTASTVWQDTAPTSSVFSVGSSSDVNTSGTTMIAYCFADVKGFSKFGSYTGNGNADGTFVYTGFKPSFFMWKITSSSGSWGMLDNKRDTFNVMGKQLFPNSDSAEASYTVLDFCSNGIKMRNTFGDTNPSGGSLIYMAFAENPFVTSTSIPTTAR
jgi:hypothetical protein